MAGFADALLLVHAGATLAMLGVAWFVQVVHYPLFEAVGPERFVRYEREHGRRTTWIVAPAMCVEAAAAGLLTLVRPGPLTGAGAALVVLLWASTFGIQVPLHARLAGGFDAHAWRRLVATSWLRTAAWSARGAIALVLLAPR